MSNETEYCYRLIAVERSGATSGSTNSTCTTPKSDPNPPQGAIEINAGAASSSSPTVELTLRGSDAPADVEQIDPDDPPTSDGATISGVSDMMIGNRADFAGAEWEPYQTNKSWTLAPQNGVASIFVKFRDAAGNESDITFDGIHISEESGHTLYLPTVMR